jgi:hypothetical protein
MFAMLVCALPAVAACGTDLDDPTASVDQAASVHLKGGAKAEPAFTDLGLALAAAGEIAGLGEGDVLIAMTANADVVATCTNPGTGEHQPPGQNPAQAEVGGQEAIPEGEIKNGNLAFSLGTEEAGPQIDGAPDCPNPNWVETVVDLQFTSAELTILQAGEVVLIVSCTFSEPTDDGPVPAGDVTCMQQQP